MTGGGEAEIDTTSIRPKTEGKHVSPEAWLLPAIGKYLSGWLCSTGQCLCHLSCWRYHYQADNSPFYWYLHKFLLSGDVDCWYFMMEIISIESDVNGVCVDWRVSTNCLHMISLWCSLQRKVTRWVDMMKHLSATWARTSLPSLSACCRTWRVETPSSHQHVGSEYTNSHASLCRNPHNPLIAHLYKWWPSIKHVIFISTIQ